MFTRESEMAEPAARWMRLSGLEVKQEFVSPWGICDLVGARFNPCKVEQRLGYMQRQRIPSITGAALLHEIPDTETGASIAIRQLVRTCSSVVPEDVLLGEIQELLKRRFIQLGSPGRVQKLNGWMPLQDAIVAVELKLKRVEEAMRQARNNLGFADESYVALPMDVARRVKLSHARWGSFFDDGVGLIGVSRSNCRTLIEARRASRFTDPIIQMYCVDKFWSVRITGN